MWYQIYLSNSYKYFGSPQANSNYDEAARKSATTTYLPKVRQVGPKMQVADSKNNEKSLLNEKADVEAKQKLKQSQENTLGSQGRKPNNKRNRK